jgi:hypothetical protein
MMKIPTIKFNLIFNILQFRLCLVFAVATRCTTIVYKRIRLAVYRCRMIIRGDVIGRQPWISVYSNTGRRTDTILSLNIQQECIHSLILVEKKYLSLLMSFIQFRNYCRGSNNNNNNNNDDDNNDNHNTISLCRN